MESAILSKKSLTIIFAFAPAGLGHMRVTDALYHGLPDTSNTVLLGTRDKLDKFFHKFINSYPTMKRLGEWTQYGLPEILITSFYRFFIKQNTYQLRHRLISIIDQRFVPSEKVIIVATHFSLAHQLASIKTSVEKQKQVKIFLIVQVTDDSPQRIWYIPGADLICVPSLSTKNKLLEYAKNAELEKSSICVLPYPISPLLTKSLESKSFLHKKNQLKQDSNSTIHVSMPVSGAAAGINFNLDVAEILFTSQRRFHFHIVSRSNSHTLPILSKLLEKSYASVYMSPKDQQVVDLYEKLFEKNNISLEITKPSEQAFKALCTPNQLGGVLLLFSPPYGRQEKDNLQFLRKNNLMPSLNLEKKLWTYSKKNKFADSQMLEDAKSWRGLRLPSDSKSSGEFILWCLREKIFSSMVNYRQMQSIEVSSKGVEMFWKKISEVIV